MAKLTVAASLAPLSGEYDATISQLTNRELHIIKLETGVRGGEIEEAINAGDNDILVALALVLLKRAGKGEIAEMRDLIWDAPTDALKWDFTGDEDPDEEELKDVPPPIAPEPEGSSNGSGANGGDNSSFGGDPPLSDRKATGTPGSGIGAPSPLPTSES